MNQNKKTSTTIAAIVLAVALAFGAPGSRR